MLHASTRVRINYNTTMQDMDPAWQSSGPFQYTIFDDRRLGIVIYKFQKNLKSLEIYKIHIFLKRSLKTSSRRTMKFQKIDNLTKYSKNTKTSSFYGLNKKIGTMQIHEQYSFLKLLSYLTSIFTNIYYNLQQYH